MRIIYPGTNFSTARFATPSNAIDLDFSAALTKESFRRGTLEVIEERTEEDGSELPQFGLTNFDDMLIAKKEVADILRPKLKENGGDVLECTMKSQHGFYIGFRAFNLLSDTPTANIFRLLEFNENPTLCVRQFLSVDFAQWMNKNLDCRGLTFRDAETDGVHKPSTSLLRRSTDI